MNKLTKGKIEKLKNRILNDVGNDAFMYLVHLEDSIKRLEKEVDRLNQHKKENCYRCRHRETLVCVKCMDCSWRLYFEDKEPRGEE